MTEEEVIKYLQQLYPNGGHCWLDEQRIEAIDMAIKALKGYGPNLTENIAKTSEKALKQREKEGGPKVIKALQEEPVKIKKGCKYRCLSDMVNRDTGNISFIGDKIYLAPKDNTLVSEENGWLCDTSENASNFELVEEPKKCMYSKDDYTDEDRKVLCDGCEEDCKYNKKETVNNNCLLNEPSIPDIVDEHFYEMLGEEPVSNVWHDAQIDPPQAKKKILAINEYGSCEVDYAINMALYWPKVIKWAYIDDLLKLDNSCQSCENLQEEPVSENLEKAAEQDVCEVVNTCSATGIPNDHIPSWVQDAMINEFIHGANWKEQQFEKNRLKHCDALTEEQAKMEFDFVVQHLKKE